MKFRPKHSRKGSIAIGVLSLTALLAPLQADDFEAGLQAYQSADYAEAADAFERAIESEESAAARHNLALAYYQQGAPAQATWQLERAVRLAPLNEDYLYKLGALRQQLGLYAAPVEWWQSAARVLPRSTWIWIASLSAWCLIATLLLPRIGGHRRSIALKLSSGAAALVGLLAAAALTILTSAQADGIIVRNKAAPLRHAPAAAAPEAGLARPGERARILDRHKDYLKIKSETQTTGWIQTDAFRSF